MLCWVGMDRAVSRDFKIRSWQVSLQEIAGDTTRWRELMADRMAKTRFMVTMATWPDIWGIPECDGMAWRGYVRGSSRIGGWVVQIFVIREQYSKQSPLIHQAALLIPKMSHRSYKLRSMCIAREIFAVWRQLSPL